MNLVVILSAAFAFGSAAFQAADAIKCIAPVANDRYSIDVHDRTLYQ